MTVQPVRATEASGTWLEARPIARAFDEIRRARERCLALLSEMENGGGRKSGLGLEHTATFLLRGGLP